MVASSGSGAPAGGGSFPHSPEEITVDWLNAVLQETGVLGDDAVEAVEVLPTAAGFGALGSYARLRLDYAPPVPGAPHIVFAKFSSDKPKIRASVHTLRAYDIILAWAISEAGACRIEGYYDK